VKKKAKFLSKRARSIYRMQHVMPFIVTHRLWQSNQIHQPFKKELGAD